MSNWADLTEVPADLGRTVVSIGNFDGVHLGHRHVLGRAAEVAAELGVDRVVAVTFEPHPMSVLRPEHAPTRLTDLADRVRLLGDAGADDVLVLPFSRELAGWSPERFVTRILVGALHAKAVVVGINFRFGHQAAGDVATLRSLGEQHDFVVEGVPLGGGEQVWSSSRVRASLADGDVESAAQALGRPFTVRGTVVRGDLRGRELGFPTANVPTSAISAAPADGVYAGWLRRLDQPDLPAYPAAVSVGANPTFAGDRERRVESYVLDRDDLELYDVEVEVAFVARIRGMLRFDSVDELVEAMHEDVARTRALLRT